MLNRSLFPNLKTCIPVVTTSILKTKKLMDRLNFFPFHIYLDIFPENGTFFGNNTLLKLLSFSIFTEINYDESMKWAAHCRRRGSRAVKKFAKFTKETCTGASFQLAMLFNKRLLGNFKKTKVPSCGKGKIRMLV